MSSATSDALEALPAAAREPLSTLTQALESAVGGNLAALLVYGSAARGGWIEGLSDIDAIVVLRDTSLGQLRAISEPLLHARHAARVEAMILKRDNIERAADVFPLLYDDVRGRHVLLSGTNPFASLTIADAHRRLRIEQELREARIRMRRAVVDAMGAEGTIDGAVSRKVKQLRSPLHALLRLKGIACDDRLEAVLAAAGKAYGVDTEPLAHVSRSVDAAHTALRSLLDVAIQDVDTLDGGRA